MKRFLTLVCLLSLILGYQNCSESPISRGSSTVGTDASVAMPLTNDPAANLAKVNFVEIPNVQEPSAGQQKLSALGYDSAMYQLQVSVDTGEINVMDDAGVVVQKLCLNQSNLDELKTILDGTSVCEVPKMSAADICGMRYKFPYAVLTSDQTQVNLGEELDSCGSGKKDLCGGISTVFQAYVDNLRQHWTEMSCN